MKPGLFCLLVSAACVACGSGAALPPKAVAHNHDGALAMQSGDLETAGTRFNLALEYNPDFIEALANLANVEIQRGNFDRARQLLLRARRLNPDFSQAHHGLGVLAEREHRRDEASNHYREALAVDPGFAEARANLARLLYEAGHYEHALEQFQKLLEVAPRNVLGHQGTAATLLSLGRLEESLDALARGTVEHPEDPELQVLYGRVALQLGDLETAKERLTPVAAGRDGAAALALAWLAVLELAADRPRYALGAARKALALEPHQPVANYALAVAAARVKDPDAAVWLERALQLNPGNPELVRLADR